METKGGEHGGKWGGRKMKRKIGCVRDISISDQQQFSSLVWLESLRLQIFSDGGTLSGSKPF